jgi:methionyl-tRNA synthetase
VQRINADLANDLGNLAQRSLSIVAKSCGGAVPDWRDGVRDKADLAMLARADELVGLARGHMKSFALHLYLSDVFAVVAETNRYFASAEPWKLAKTNPQRMRMVLYTTMETLRIVAILLQPAMPASMSRLLDLLAVSPERRTFADVDQAGTYGDLASPKRLQPGALPAPAPVFPRYVEQAAAK